MLGPRAPRNAALLARNSRRIPGTIDGPDGILAGGAGLARSAYGIAHTLPVQPGGSHDGRRSPGSDGPYHAARGPARNHSPSADGGDRSRGSLGGGGRL